MSNRNFLFWYFNYSLTACIKPADPPILISPAKLLYKLTTDFTFYITLTMIKALVISMQALWFISEAAVLTDIDAATISEVGPVHILREIIISEYRRKSQQSC